MDARQKCCLVFVLAVAGGCGQSRVHECEKLIDKVNQSNNAVGSGAGGVNGKVVLDLVTSIDGAKAQVLALHLSDERLKEYQASYVRVLETLSAAAKAMPGAAAEKDQHATETSLERIRAASAEETAVVNRINRYCHTDSK